MPLKFSVTSVMLPHLDLPQTCALLRDCGYQGLELRVRYYTGAPDAPYGSWGRHATDVSPDNIVSRAGEIRAVLADHGLTLVTFASNATCTDLATATKLADGAVAVGCPRVRLGSPRGYDGKVNYWELYDEAVRAYEKALAITRPRGLRVLIEIHGGTIFVSASLAYRLVSNFSPRDIGVIYDPQNMAADGWETTPLALDLLGDYVAHLHIGGHRPVAAAPDAQGTVRWSWPGCRLEEGRIDYPLLLAELARRRYPGYLSLEDFDATRAPEQKVREAIAYLRRISPADPA